MSWGVAGSSPFGDLTDSEHVLAKEYIDDNWSLTGPLELADPNDTKGAKVKLGTGWSKGINNTYEIHCVMGAEAPPEKANVDWSSQKRRVGIDVHYFVKRNDSTGEEPAELGQIKRELQRIIGLENSLQTGTLWTEGASRRADDPEDMGPVRYYHRIIETLFEYWQVKTT